MVTLYSWQWDQGPDYVEDPVSTHARAVPSSYDPDVVPNRLVAGSDIRDDAASDESVFGWGAGVNPTVGSFIALASLDAGKDDTNIDFSTYQAYIDIPLEAVPGKELALDELQFAWSRGGGAQPRGFQVRSSHDNYSTVLFNENNVPTSRPTMTSYVVPLSSIPQTGAVTLRLYVWTPFYNSDIESYGGADGTGWVVTGEVVTLSPWQFEGSIRGPQGLVGPTGPAGPTGPEGATGGGLVSGKWRYNDNTAPPPATGEIRGSGDFSTVGNTGTLWLSHTDYEGLVWEGFSVDVGNSLVIRSYSSEQYLFEITSKTDLGDYSAFGVTLLSRTQGDVRKNETVEVGIFRSGSVGPTGPTGPTGPGLDEAAADLRYVNVDGDTMSGKLTVNADIETGYLVSNFGAAINGELYAPYPSQSGHAATKQYVDDRIVTVPTPIIGELRMGMWDYSPAPNWIYCDGQQFDELVYPALFTLLGKNTVPDMTSRVPMGIGWDGLTSPGDIGGSNFIDSNQLPRHKHTVTVSNDSHSHTGAANSGGNHDHLLNYSTSLGANFSDLARGRNADRIGQNRQAIAYEGAHTHSLSINSSSHGHTTTVSEEGNNETFEPRHVRLGFAIYAGEPV